MTILDRFSQKGRVALVTGAARGLGFEIAKALAEAGACRGDGAHGGDARRGGRGDH